jgi:hypothetical protein
LGQWQAAYRLVDRGARTSLMDAATLGLLGRVAARFEDRTVPTPDEVTRAFWGACHGGQQPVAELLLGLGADLNWIGHDNMTPLDVARASAGEGLSSAATLVPWLVGLGATSAK